MKEKPILFSTPMVQAILDGSKTQTRRVIKPQPKNVIHNNEYGGFSLEFDGIKSARIPCKPGDILWVRETWGREYRGGGGAIIKYFADNEKWNLPEGEKWMPSIHMPRAAARLFLKVKSVRVELLQDITEEDAKAEGFNKECHCITKTRNPTIIGCGGGPEPIGDCNDCDLYKASSFKEGFFFGWETLNAKRGYSWKINPWVWVIEFKRIKP